MIYERKNFSVGSDQRSMCSVILYSKPTLYLWEAHKQSLKETAFSSWAFLYLEGRELLSLDTEVLFAGWLPAADQPTVHEFALLKSHLD